MTDEILTVEAKDINFSRKSYGFHFTNLNRLLGREAIPEQSFSVGLEDMLQTYNRTLNNALDEPISGLQVDFYKPYLPASASNKEANQKLSTDEAFEYMKNYFSVNTYLIFETSIDGLHSEAIKPETFRRISVDGKTDAISVVRALFDRRDKSKSYALRSSQQYDVELIEAFLDYTRLPSDLTQEEKEEFFEAIKKYRDLTGRALLAERRGETIPTFSEEDQNFVGKSGIAKIHEIAEQILASRTNQEGTITIEMLTTNALTVLDGGLVPAEDYIREADRTKRKAREAKNPNE